MTESYRRTNEPNVKKLSAQSAGASGGRDLRRIEEWLAAMIQLVPLMPLMKEAVDAELEAPGYGAEAVMFRALINEVQR